MNSNLNLLALTSLSRHAGRWSASSDRWRRSATASPRDHAPFTLHLIPLRCGTDAARQEVGLGLAH